MEQWQSRSTFVLALAAVAVGMGNVWRFGYLLGENGGAPFMLSYVAALLILVFLLGTDTLGPLCVGIGIGVLVGKYCPRPAH